MMTQYSAVSSLAGKSDIGNHTEAHNAQITIQALCHMNSDYTTRYCPVKGPQ
jgi:hypothetical protein